jgi:hypothetical protein
MPVVAAWVDNDQTLMVYRFESPWTMEQVYAALDAGLRLMAVVPHPVDSLFDFSQSGTAPSQILMAMRYAERHPPDNLRYSVVFGLNPFLALLVGVAQRVAPRLMQNVRITKTRDEALVALEEMRKSMGK